MLWLERPPILRWTAASLLVMAAAWSELAPPPTAESVFMAEDVAAGTPLEERHVERRPVPTGLFPTVEPHGLAATHLQAGDPLVGSMITEVAVPTGWVTLEASVPSHASPGARATAVVVDGGTAPIEFPALVVGQGASDPFGEGGGTIAVPGEWVGPAAAAAAESRLVIGVESPGQ